MISPVPKPWAAVNRDFRLYRTDDPVHQGIFITQIDQVLPIAGVISIVALMATGVPLLAKHVAHRVAHIVSVEGTPEWRALDKVITASIDALASAHGLGAQERHHVANSHHSGRMHAHPSHVSEDLFAEYLLTGKVPLKASGGAVRVDDGKRRYVAYAQPGHEEESKKILSHFSDQFAFAANPLLDSLEGKVLVA